MALIDMDYEEVLAEARQIDEMASRAESYLSEMKQLTGSIPASWTGDASQSFLQICAGWDREMNELVGSLHSTSRNLRLLAQEIRAAEERARNAMK
ncbi:MAG TPA: WXG100 family type VII secretion target [Syntrophomonadaceae bacterium]|nr:WXG100 family type VII secretion target [Syntrophomonadaceae bacterium]